MIYIKLTNGFGNNLFQYIAGRLLAEHHSKKLILIPPFKDYYALNDIEQLNLFYDDIIYDIDSKSSIIIQENEYLSEFDPFKTLIFLREYWCFCSGGRREAGHHKIPQNIIESTKLC